MYGHYGPLNHGARGGVPVGKLHLVLYGDIGSLKCWWSSTVRGVEGASRGPTPLIRKYYKITCILQYYEVALARGDWTNSVPLGTAHKIISYAAPLHLFAPVPQS